MHNVVFNKTRLAPTPSGYLHLGNAFSFMITAGLARQAGATLLLRIDDLDQARVQPQYVQDIFDTLNFLQIEWSEGPASYAEYTRRWSQVHRLPLYAAALQQLREAKAVYACTCSRTQWQPNATAGCPCLGAQLSLDTPGANWRLLTNAAIPLTIQSPDGSSVTSFLPAVMQWFVVRKKDGYPAYQLTSLVDDEHFGVDAIVRGQDLWESTLAQHYLAQVLGKTFFKDVRFYHHPLVMEAGGHTKLSKSAGATSIRHLRLAGNKRSEVIAMLRPWVDDSWAAQWLEG